MSQEINDFFENNKSIIYIGKKRHAIDTIEESYLLYKSYIETNTLSPTDKTGQIYVGKEHIASFSKDGSLWNTNEEIIWSEIE